MMPGDRSVGYGGTDFMEQQGVVCRYYLTRAMRGEDIFPPLIQK